MAHRRESPEQLATFERYFRQGDSRSIERLSVELEGAEKRRSLRTLYGWSSRFAWQQRIAEIEGRNSAAADEQLRLEYAAMQERHQRIGRALQKAALERLATLPRDMKAGEVASLVQIGVAIETRARPQPEKKIDITASVRAMAIEEGLDPQQAVLDAQRIVAKLES